MRLRQIAIVNRLNSPSVVLFDVAAIANPFRAQGRKSLLHITVKIHIAPWAACVVHAHRVVDFDFTVHGLSRCERDFPERNANVGMKLPRNVSLLRIWKLAVALAHEKIELGKQEKRNSFSWVPGFLIVLLTTKKPCAKNRMAENPSPASDPRSLRRHYPHQVQGVVQLDLSAMAAPPQSELTLRS